MKNKILYIYILGIIIFASSCKTEVELNAPWKDTPVVYGLLEANKDTQYLKINKCFLGNTDAYTMAKEPDSLNYPYKLEVRVEKWKNGTLKKTYYLDTITLPNMQDGIFATNKNLAYYFKTPTKTDPLDYESTYKLFIRNPKTGKEITSTTAIINKFSLVEPYIAIQTNTQGLYSNQSNRFAKINFEFLTPKNGKLFEIYTRINYIEYHPGQSDSIQKYMDWNIGRYSVLTTDGGYDVRSSASAEELYYLLANSLTIDPTINRKLGKLGNPDDQINYIVYAASEDLSTYIDVKKPSNTIIQEKPNFSNITNAMGIFSSRYTLTVKNISIDYASFIYLRDSELTKNLNFK